MPALVQKDRYSVRRKKHGRTKPPQRKIAKGGVAVGQTVGTLRLPKVQTLAPLPPEPEPVPESSEPRGRRRGVTHDWMRCTIRLPKGMEDEIRREAALRLRGFQQQVVVMLLEWLDAHQEQT